MIDNFLGPETELHAPALMRPPYRTSIPGTRRVDPDAPASPSCRASIRSSASTLSVDALERHGLREFVFDVYGSGEDLEVLRARASGLSNVTFHGFVPNVAQALPNADLLLHLCPQEPFGLVILEAFRSRLLVLVPDRGGMRARW